MKVKDEFSEVREVWRIAFVLLTFLFAPWSWEGDDGYENDDEAEDGKDDDTRDWGKMKQLRFNYG